MAGLYDLARLHGKNVMYITDTDCNIATNDDRVINLIAIGETESSAVVEAGSYGNIEYLDGSFVYYTATGLCRLSLAGESTAFVNADTTALSGKYRAVYDSEDVLIALLYTRSISETDTEGNELTGSGIFGIFYDKTANAWGHEIQLTTFEADMYYESFDAEYLSDTELLIDALVSNSTLGEDNTYNSEYYHIVGIYTLDSDVSVDKAEFMYSGLIEDAESPFKLTFTNTGAKTAKNITVKIIAPDGTEITDVEIVMMGNYIYDEATEKYVWEEEATVASGESVELYFNATIDDFVVGEYKIIVSCDNDNTPENNSAKLVLAYTDLIVSAKQTVIGENNSLVKLFLLYHNK